MATNEKEPLTPAQRRRRMEIRKRKERERKRRKRRKMLLIGLFVVLAIVIVGLLVYLFSQLFGGDKKISAGGTTFVIAIDAGHGGEDTGMSSGEATEKEIDLNIASKLKIMLESQGCTVVMTRADDSYLAKEDRVSAADASGADLLVSIHCNYSEEDASLSGVRVSYEDGDRAGKTLAKNIEAQLVSESGAVDGGTQTGDYVIVTETGMPAVLAEVGYLSNAEEAASLAEDTYQNDIAKGIAKGILLSLNQ